MPSGVDSAWCRIRSARATPNEAVPLPAWAGYVTRPGLRILCRQIDRHSGGQIRPFPNRDAYHPRLICARNQLPSAAPMSLPAPNPAMAPA